MLLLLLAAEEWHGGYHCVQKLLSMQHCTMRAELIGHFEPCMTEIYLHIDARVADYIRTHP